MSSAASVAVVADDREPRGMGECFSDIDGVQLQWRRLALGDYILDDRILFERKTFIDFAESIKTGRLFNQACRLAASRYRSVFVLEGRKADLAASGMSRESIQGAIITLSIILGLPILRSQSMRESARLIIYTGRQILRHPKGAIYRHGYRPRGQRKRKLFVLQGLPGIGPERAANLLDHFSSLESVFLAEEDELAQVKGIGYSTAGRIRELVREARSFYDPGCGQV